jgi:hypothetical protein
MESLAKTVPKRKRGDEEDQTTPMVDTANPEVAAVAERKIVKAKKRVTIQQEQEHKLYDEDGNEIEFEGDVIEEVGIEEDVI